jgi:beta-barrel assembly-enhancing protease
MSLKSLLLFIFLACCISSFSQNSQFINYKPLKSTGEIPLVFRQLSYDRYNQEISQIAPDKNGKISKQKKDFWLKSSFGLSEILTSGKVLFGDPISLYISDVAKELLKFNPELFSKLQFYTLKSSVSNASSTANGVIFFNIGLFAKLNNEAEVAFILAHEISHYIAEDPLNSYIDKIEIIKGKRRFDSKSIDDKINQLGVYSRNIEFKADSLATILFCKSKYASSNISGALKCLYYSYLPPKNFPFDITFFNSNDFKVPGCFFLDSISPVLPIKDDNDENKTHPNILKRLKQVEDLTKDFDNSSKEDFLVSKNRFLEAKELALFELVRLDLISRDYGDCIYLSYCLLKKYPKNEYLQLNIAKSLYGLCKYKNADEFHRAAVSYTKAQGESQQVHFFIRQLSQNQLNVLALKYIIDLKKQVGKNNCLQQLESDLIDELVVKSKLTIEFFKSEANNIGQPKNGLSQIEKQNYFADFYRSALKEEIKQEAYIKKFESAAKTLKSLTEFENLSYKEKGKAIEERQKKIKEEGLDYSPDTIFILEPFYDFEAKDINSELVQSESNKTKYQKSLSSIILKGGNKIPIMSYSGLNSSDIDSYNLISAYMELANEKFSNKIENFYPIGSYIIDYYKDTQNSALCLNGIYDGNEGKHYYNFFIDLKTGKFIFVNDEEISSIKKINSYLENDLSLFKNN